MRVSRNSAAVREPLLCALLISDTMRSLFSTLALILGYSFIFTPSNEARLIPKHYTLNFKVDPFNGTLSGNVTYRVYAEEKSEFIELFADPSIIVRNVIVTPDESANSTNKLSVTKIEKKDAHKLVLTVDQKIVKNTTYDLMVVFEGLRATNYSDNSSFYFINSTDTATNKNTLFYIIDLTKNTTKGLFPCFYGPKYVYFKIPFNLTIIRPKSFKIATISNASTSLVQSKQHADYIHDTYSQTSPIRIHQFVLIATNSSDIVEISKKESQSCPNTKLDYRLNKNLLSCALKYLTDFYGVPISSNTLYVVTLPDSYDIQIRTFGLITFSNSVVRDSQTVSYSIRKLNDLWWEYIPDSVHPDTKPLISALSWVATRDILPKIIRKSNAAEYENYACLLDWPYLKVMREEWKRNKNASTCYFNSRDTLALNMVKDVLGDRLFTLGLKDVLTKRHKLLKEEDIWKHLNHVAMMNGTFKTPDFPHSIEEIVRPFRNRSLFSIPILDFNSEVYDSFGGYINQVPYAYTKSAYMSQVYRNSVNKTGTLIWKVPLVFVTKSNTQAIRKSAIPGWATRQNRAVALINTDPKEILLLNPGVRGPFLVNYCKNSWNKIFDNFDTFDVQNKTKYILDVHFLAQSGHLNYTDYVKYILKLKASKENLPLWAKYLQFIPQVEDRMSGETKNLTRRWFVKQLTEMYTKFLNVSGDQPFWIRNLQRNFRKFLCWRDVPHVCNESAEFKVLAENIRFPGRLSADYIYSVFNNETVTPENWQQLRNNVTRFCDNYTSCDFSNAVHLLTNCSRNQSAVTDLVNSMLTKKKNVSCLTNEVSNILQQIKHSVNGSTIIFNYFVKNWKDILQKFPDQMESIVETLIDGLRSEKSVNEALAFFSTEEVRKGITLNYVVEDSIQKLQEQLKWNNNTLPIVHQLLKANTTVIKAGR